jgi:hypothetical protein
MYWSSPRSQRGELAKEEIRTLVCCSLSKTSSSLLTESNYMQGSLNRLDSDPLCQSQVEENRAYGILRFGSPGGLAQSTDSGAGKRRIFAIGNYVNRWLQKPLHDWLMKAL